MSGRPNTTRIAIIAVVAAFFISSFSLSALVLWDATRNKDDGSSEEDQNAQLQEQLDQQNKEQTMNNQPLEGYQAETFDKASVNKLKVEVLKQGNGQQAKPESNVTANYFGWTSDAKIFDSSRKDGKTMPVPFPLNGVIEGWTEGLSGIKAGSVVKLTIPADKAYKEAGRPPVIGPNEPLAFIIELVEVK